MYQLQTKNESEVNPEFLENEYFVKDRFSTFSELSTEQVSKLVKKSTTKSCELDPINTRFLKEHLDQFLPLITDIVNKSLMDGQFPQDVKNALVRPLLKKANLELMHKNYRPVSNLEYLSKIIERAACEQIIAYTETTSMVEPLQSAYRQSHSTETALLKIKSDILQMIDNGEVVCMTLLDLSAAFDTVSHELLLNRLKFRFGFGGKVLTWLKSYLINRTQQVVVGDMHGSGSISEKICLKQGVPQGSILGPILYNLYTSPIGNVCRSHGVNFHSYADDQQDYISFNPKHVGDKEECILKLERCIQDIRTWMNTNLLKLNSEKTEFIVFGTRWNLEKYGNDINVQVGNDSIAAVTNVRNLGFQMDSTCKNALHVNKLCRTLYATIKRIRQIRKNISSSTAKTLMQALVLSRLDYCNSLLMGTAKTHIHKLQKIMNMGVRVIYNLSKFDHITAALTSLHWLKVEFRIVFKVALLMFKCKNSIAPQYLSDILPVKTCQRAQRSMHLHDYPITYCKTSLAKEGSFRQAGPSVWNSLPEYIKSETSLVHFKRNLKTYLFSKCYH